MTGPAGSKRRGIVLQINRLWSSWNKSSMKYYMSVWQLGVPHVRVLHTLGDNGELASRDIVAITLMNKGLVSRTLSDLKEKRLVASTAEGSDGRIALWSLTKSGDRLAESLRTVRDLRQKQLLEDFQPHELAQLDDLFERLFQAAERIREREAKFLADAETDAPRASADPYSTGTSIPRDG